jgi:hypothetical protein
MKNLTSPSPHEATAFVLPRLEQAIAAWAAAPAGADKARLIATMRNASKYYEGDFRGSIEAFRDIDL